MILPIFPLSIYILPQGITRLRIFENRYLNMVKEAIKNQGFILSLFKENINGQWGSWVEIIDFDQGKDGVLIIDVKCKSLVSIKDSFVDDNKLLRGEVTKKKHWADFSCNESTVITSDVSQSKFTAHNNSFNTYYICKSLDRFFENNRELNELYKYKKTDNINWVCARWLELLPIKLSGKIYFTHISDIEHVVTFLNGLFTDESSPVNSTNEFI